MVPGPGVAEQVWEGDEGRTKGLDDDWREMKTGHINGRQRRRKTRRAELNRRKRAKCGRLTIRGTS